MADHRFRPDTLAIHAGQIPDAETGARAVPIYQTTRTSSRAPTTRRASSTCRRFGNVYSRLSNPTVAVFEERVAALEGGRAAVATASGQAAETVALLDPAGGGRPRRLVAKPLRRQLPACSPSASGKLGIETHARRRPDLGQWLRRGDAARRKAFFAETLGNPTIRRDRHRGARRSSRTRRGVPLIVDNTVAVAVSSASRSRYGADIVVHSATKFLGGHGTDDRRRDRRERPVPVGQRQVPRHDRAVGGLPRRASSSRPSATSASRCKARMEMLRVYGADDRALQRMADAAGHRDAAGAHGAALRQRAARRASSSSSTRGRGSTTRASPNTRTTRSRSSYLPRGAGSLLLAFGIKGGLDAGVRLHRGAAAR